MAALEDRSPRWSNDLIDGFVDRGEVDFAEEFSVLMPSQVFLTLLGLPLADLDLFLKMKDGIIRPDHVVGKPRDDAETLAYQNEIGQSIYDYFNRELDEREVERRDDLLSRLPRRRGRRRAPHAARTSSTSASSSSSPASTP